MSFLRLKVASEAWKNFTSTLQRKLRKLNKSKAAKKRKNQQSASEKEHRRVKKKAVRGRRYHRRYLFKKKAEPVYVDRLFKEPTAEVVTKFGIEGAAAGTSNGGRGWEEGYEIDKRADAFIRKFRADLRRQEMLARRL